VLASKPQQGSLHGTPPDVPPPSWVVSAAAFSPDGKLALTGYNVHARTQAILDSFEYLKLWDVRTGELLHSMKGHKRAVEFVTFLANGKQALSASRDGTLRFWDTDTGKEVRTIAAHRPSFVRAAASRDATLLLTTGSQDDAKDKFKLWALPSGKLLRAFDHQFDPLWIQLAPDGRLALFGMIPNQRDESTLKLLDLKNGRIVRSFSRAEEWAGFGSFSPDGRYWVTAKSDPKSRKSNVVLIEAATGKEAKRFEAVSRPPIAGVFTPDSKYVTTVRRGDVFTCWEVASGNEIYSFAIAPRVVAFSPDGKLALTAAGEDSVARRKLDLQLWDVRKGKFLRNLGPKPVYDNVTA
jgi:WD40 repeat protein